MNYPIIHSLSLTFYALMAFCCFGFELSAFTVDSQSNGSIGELIVEANEVVVIDVPSDGILHYTNVNIGSGANVSFNSDKSVYLLATGDIFIRGTIDISGKAPSSNSYEGGKAGPGGWDGGKAYDSLLTNEKTAGGGPGGGLCRPSNDYGQSASYATVTTYSNQVVYGSPLLFPLMGGSGGGGGRYHGGCGGGGAILLASNTLIEVGYGGGIYARGAGRFSTGGAGSGGGIRLLAPKVSLESGNLDVSSYRYNTQFGGDGYIRIDTGEFVRTSSTGLYGSVSVGKNNLVFPENMPALKIVEVAGTLIEDDASVEVEVPFPQDESSIVSKPITIEASDFDSLIELEIRVVPLGATSDEDIQVTEVTLDNTTSNPVQDTFDIDFPTGAVSQVFVYTKGSIR